MCNPARWVRDIERRDIRLEPRFHGITMQRIERGIKRKTDPSLFMSHSSKDKSAARKIAIDLTSLQSRRMTGRMGDSDRAEFDGHPCPCNGQIAIIAILMTDNYNTSIWAKAEYNKSLVREQMVPWSCIPIADKRRRHPRLSRRQDTDRFQNQLFRRDCSPHLRDS